MTAINSNIPVRVAEHATSSLGDGKKTVTTAGTRVALAASTAAKWVTVQAYHANTGKIGVGGATIDATSTTGTGVALQAGETVTFPIRDLADVWLDATVNGEGVRYTYGV